MKDRDYDIAMLEIKLKNDELMREWLEWKLGRRGEFLNAERNVERQRTENANQAEATNIIPTASNI
jgi:hypothetical protein